MNAIEEGIKRLEKMKTSAAMEATNIIKSNPELLSNLNRDQLKDGINASGQDMPLYVTNSKAPQAPGKIKLFAKGRYTRGIKPLFANEITMTSTDGKVRFLDPKYPLALGLNDASISVLQELVRQELPRKLIAI